ncbi:MAG: hypothetical protein AAGC63_10950 [Propionicimonas sp.]
MDPRHEVVLARLAELDARLASGGERVLSLQTAQMQVSVSLVDRRTPILRESYQVAGDWTFRPQWRGHRMGEVVVEHRLTLRVLRSAPDLETLLRAVVERVDAFSTPARAYATALGVIGGTVEWVDDPVTPHEFANWAIHAYWARVQGLPATIALYSEVSDAAAEALETRFGVGVWHSPSGEGDLELREEGLVQRLPDGTVVPVFTSGAVVPSRIMDAVLKMVGLAALAREGLQ